MDECIESKKQKFILILSRHVYTMQYKFGHCTSKTGLIEHFVSATLPLKLHASRDSRSYTR